MRTKPLSLLALKRTSPNARMALYYHDFKTRVPSDAEMLAGRCAAIITAIGD